MSDFPKIRITHTFDYELTEREVQKFLQNLMTSGYRQMLRHFASERDTAVAKGKCPFPLECNCYEKCDKTWCNYDRLNNGNAYRLS
mgnify:CR=1 FL=1